MSQKVGEYDPYFQLEFYSEECSDASCSESSDTDVDERIERLVENVGLCPEPPTLTRTLSFSRAEVTVHNSRAHFSNLKLRNAWCVDRSSFQLTPLQKNRLGTFHTYLQSAINSLLTAIKAIISKEVQQKPNSKAALVDQVIAEALNCIPFAGPLVKKGIEFLGPVENSMGDCRKSKFKNLSQFLTTHHQEDAINSTLYNFMTSSLMLVSHEIAKNKN